MKCPGCQQEIEQFFEVPSNSLEPFTGVDAIKSLSAWGGLDVPRTVICQQGEYTHFIFDHSGEAHLVKMVIFDQEELARQHDLHEENPKRCEHCDKSDQDEDHKEQCQAMGIPCYYNWSDSEPAAFYCTDHAHDEGFCPGCGLFQAGIESFDFSKTGYCAECQEAFEDEFEDEEVDEFEDMDWEDEFEDY